jgi:hypothetical protein
MNEVAIFPLFIVQEGHLWSAIDTLGSVRAQATSKALLIDSLPLIIHAIQTAAAMRLQMRNTAQIIRFDASWIA